MDVWKVTAKFANILKDVDVSHVKLYEDRREGRTGTATVLYIYCLLLLEKIIKSKTPAKIRIPDYFIGFDCLFFIYM